MQIETKRLLLRPPRKSDWKDIVEGAGDLKVSSMTAVIPHPYNKKDGLWFINEVLKKWKKKKRADYTWFIELKKEKKVIGVTGIHKISEQDKKCRAGSWVNKKYWRKSYIVEAKIPIFDFAFNKLKLRKIETEAFVKNKASNGMQRKLGFKFEGTKRKTTVCMAIGKIHDSNMYGLLKNEWGEMRSRLIKYLKTKQKNDAQF